MKIYDIGGDASVVSIISEGLKKRSQSLPTIIYTAENHNHAAEILQDKLSAVMPEGLLDGVQILNIPRLKINIM